MNILLAKNTTSLIKIKNLTDNHKKTNTSICVDDDLPIYMCIRGDIHANIMNRVKNEKKRGRGEHTSMEKARGGGKGGEEEERRATRCRTVMAVATRKRGEEEKKREEKRGREAATGRVCERRAIGLT